MNTSPKNPTEILGQRAKAPVICGQLVTAGCALCDRFGVVTGVRDLKKKSRLWLVVASAVSMPWPTALRSVPGAKSVAIK